MRAVSASSSCLHPLSEVPLQWRTGIVGTVVDNFVHVPLLYLPVYFMAVPLRWGCTAKCRNIGALGIPKLSPRMSVS